MTHEPDKVDLETPDLAADHRAALARLFPGVLADGVLDADKLGELLDVQVARVAEGRERYGLHWAGKQQAVRSLLAPSRGALVPDLDQSDDFDHARNVFIEGDNLEVLKLLQKAYNDQVKLIYIDPPYNTGRDFVYNDDFSDTTRRYLVWSGQVDEEGNRKSDSSDAASGRLHSRWLSMMYPRLVLARNLLTPDGMLLVSINDVEMPSLVHLLREVFGPENHLATFVWNNDGNIEQQSAFKVNHEYIVAFARDVEQVARPTVIDPNIGEDSKLFNDRIENSITKNGPANPPSEVVLPAGFPASADDFEVAPRTDKWPHVLDPITVQGGVLSKPARVFSGWSSKRLLELFISNGLVPIEDSEGKSTWFAMTPTGAIYGYKQRSAGQGHVLTVLRNLGTTKASSSRMAREWGVTFDFPKPERLIQYLVSVFTGTDDLVMDFFAGSGSTAHGVALQNADDGGSRRYLLVNIPEPTGAESAARKAGFETVAEITYKRIAAVRANVKGAAESGLRVYRLNESAFLDSAPDEGELTLSSSTLRAGVDDLYAIAAEVLLKEGIPLDSEWVEHEFGGVSVQVSGSVAVVAGEGIDISTVGMVFDLDPKPHVVVFLEDDLAGQDALKANLVANAKSRGITVKTV
jgi:adenine-specific DNA-methyltransferase